MAGKKSKTKPKKYNKLNWAKLIEGLPKVYEEKISFSYFSELYGYVVDYCTSFEVVEHRNNWQIENALQGEDLYKSLEGILLMRTKALKEMCDSYVGEEFLEFYVTKWNEYERCSVILDKICTYLNKNWIHEEHRLKHKNIYPIYQLAIIMWKDMLLQDFKTLATTEAVKLIANERRGDTSNMQLVSNLLRLYMELGINNNEEQNEETGIYKESFEKLYLRETELFYAQLSERFLEHNSVTDYLDEIEKLFKAEEKRAQRYLHKSSFESLEKSLERALIQKQLDKFLVKFSELLNIEEEDDDLNRIYMLVARNPEDLVGFRTIFEKFVVSEGLSALQKCCKSAQNDPRKYVTVILEVYKKFRVYISEMFNNDSTFVSTLDKACNAFVNSNSITKLTNSKKPLELLSKYCDLLLKKSSTSTNDDELEKALDDVVIIIKYVDDKDAFIHFYAVCFAKRLLHQTSISERMETLMISKLRHDCSILTTSRLSKMMNDILTSKDVNMEFIAHLNNLNEPIQSDFSVQILTNFIWPYKQSESNNSISFPNEFERIVRKFSAFYSEKYPTKTLHWLCNISTGEISTDAFKRSYVWQANIFQITVLLRYNESTAWSMSQLQDQTQIRMEDLRQVVQSLTKASILICSDDDNNLTLNSVLSLNMNYSNKKQRVNLNAANKKSDADEKSKVNHIEENRKFVTQAYIMKILKNHKMLKRDELVQKVLDQVKPQFKLNMNIISKCIDHLVQKQYLEMEVAEDEDDVKYKYVA